MAEDAARRTPIHPHLRHLQAEAVAVTEAAQHLLDALSGPQLTWKPDPGTWSVAECFDHLSVTNRLYVPRIRRAIERAGQNTLVRPFRPSWLGRLFIRLSGPGSRWKLKAPGLFKPTPAAVDPLVVRQFVEQQEALLALIQQASAVNLNTAKLRSPATRLLRLSVGEALTLLVVHEQRHLQQAQRLTRRSDFPAG